MCGKVKAARPVGESCKAGGAGRGRGERERESAKEREREREGERERESERGPPSYAVSVQGHTK